MFSIPLPDVPLPAGGGAKITRIPHRPVWAAFSSSPGPHSAAFFGSPRSVLSAVAVSTAPARIRPPLSTASGPHLATVAVLAAPVRFVSPPRPFWQPPHRIWQSVAGFGRLRTAEQSAGQYVKKRAVPLRGPIGAQRQSARRPCPWRPAGRRGSCRRPWRRRAGRHRRPASNGPLRGPRHRH